MKARFNPFVAAPDAYKAVLALENYVREGSGLSHRLLHLIKLRASILNGCAHCVDMHVKESRKDGLSEQWINLVSVWREAGVYTEAERAVLGWTDALTLLSQTGAPDADFESLRSHFTEQEIANITVAIGVINVWNRIAVGMRLQHPVDVNAKAA
jgi:AhpD family alkylhydroperoxidase